MWPCFILSNKTYCTFSLKVSTIPNTFLIILLFVVLRYTLLTCIFFIKGQQCDNFKILVSFKQILYHPSSQRVFWKLTRRKFCSNTAISIAIQFFYREGALGYLFPLLVKLGLLQPVDITICPHAVNTYQICCKLFKTGTAFHSCFFKIRVLTNFPISFKIFTQQYALFLFQDLKFTIGTKTYAQPKIRQLHRIHQL